MFPRFFRTFPPPPTASLFAADLVLPLLSSPAWLISRQLRISFRQTKWRTQRAKKEPCPRPFGNGHGRLEDRGVPKAPASDRCSRQNPAAGFQTAQVERQAAVQSSAGLRSGDVVREEFNLHVFQGRNQVVVPLNFLLSSSRQATAS
jgi:hypothetical protein